MNILTSRRQSNNFNWTGMCMTISNNILVVIPLKIMFFFLLNEVERNSIMG
jgi:hypothetical protein